MTPLAGITVLDFSTLLPGPLATLLLAEAGADVIKVERPGSGDEMRGRQPRFGSDSAIFAMLNCGKRSIAIDLKDASALERLRPLIAKTDVLVEQFRPGVMARLGFGYDAVRAINPRIIYCALTGYGQSGDRAQQAGHDLNYVAESGLSSLVTGADGLPPMPAAPFADIGGGSYPVVINVLLALLQRTKTGEGCFLDVAMSKNLLPFGYWGLAHGWSSAAWPQPDGGALTGRLARYRHYRTKDGRYLAVAALEEKFWSRFCDLIDLPAALRDDRKTPVESTRAVAEILIARDAEDWWHLFDGQDVCCSIVKTVEEAARSVDGRFSLAAGDCAMPALPLPIVDPLRRAAGARTAPALGDANAMLSPVP